MSTPQPEKTPRAHLQILPAQDAVKTRFVMDGSNMAHPRDAKHRPSVRYVLQVRDALCRQFSVQPSEILILLDAGTVYKFPREERSIVEAMEASGTLFRCPAGAEADGYVLNMARQQNAVVVSTDQFSKRKAAREGLTVIKPMVFTHSVLVNDEFITWGVPGRRTYTELSESLGWAESGCYTFDFCAMFQALIEEHGGAMALGQLGQLAWESAPEHRPLFKTIAGRKSGALRRFLAKHPDTFELVGSHQVQLRGASAPAPAPAPAPLASVADIEAIRAAMRAHIPELSAGTLRVVRHLADAQSGTVYVFVTADEPVSAIQACLGSKLARLTAVRADCGQRVVYLRHIDDGAAMLAQAIRCLRLDVVALCLDDPARPVLLLGALTPKQHTQAASKLKTLRQICGPGCRPRPAAARAAELDGARSVLASIFGERDDPRVVRCLQAGLWSPAAIARAHIDRVRVALDLDAETARELRAQL